MAAAPSDVLMTVLLLSALLAGAVCILLGLRGRVINSNPICRHCRFDLIGVHPCATCPECGADLSAAGAVRFGLRRRRRGVLVTGTFLLLVAFVGGTALLWGRVAGFNWNSIKPDALLMWEARFRSGHVNDAGVLHELASRVQSGGLSSDRTSELVRRAMAAQADRSTPWTIAWGDLAEMAHRAGKIEASDWGTYLKQGATHSMRARRRSRAGEPIVVEFVTAGQRLGKNIGGVSVPRERRVWLVDAKGTRVVSETSTDGGTEEYGFGGVSSRRSSVKLAAPSGEYVLHAAWDVDYFERGVDTDDPSLRIGRETFEAEQPVTLVPPGEPVVLLRPDESMRARILRSLTLTVQVVASGPVRPDFRYTFTDLPVNVAFRAIARLHGAPADAPAIDFGTVVQAICNGQSQTMSGVDLPAGLNAQSLDFTLTPDPVAAEQTPDMETIWDGVLIIEGVPVTPPRQR